MTQIVIDASFLNYEEVIENMKSFSGLEITVKSPFLSNEDVPLEYFVTRDSFTDLIEAANSNDVKLIFNVPLSGLGTKTSQNKSLLQRYVSKKDLSNKIKSIPSEMKGLLKKKHFVKDSIAKRMCLVLRVGSKSPSSTMRLLDLENKDVMATHKKVIEFLGSQEITDINITDVPESYVKSITTDSDLTIHQQPSFAHEKFFTHDTSIGFRVTLEQNQIQLTSLQNLQWLQAHGQNVDEKYKNNKTKVSIIFANNGMMVINQHSAARHKCNKKWPQRSFGADVAGKYLEVQQNIKVEINHHGDFVNQLVTEPNTVQLFNKC